jgi:hypothetical protein
MNTTNRLESVNGSAKPKPKPKPKRKTAPKVLHKKRECSQFLMPEARDDREAAAFAVIAAAKRTIDHLEEQNRQLQRFVDLNTFTHVKYKFLQDFGLVQTHYSDGSIEVTDPHADSEGA